MYRRLSLLALPVLAALAMIAPASASAMPTVDFLTPVIQVPEGVGNAVVTIHRTGSVLDLAIPTTVRYSTTATASARRDIDFTNVSGAVHYLPGQADATFTVPVRNDSVSNPVKKVQLDLYGLQGGQFPNRADSAHGILQINDDDGTIVGSRDAANPLGLFPAPTGGDPLRGMKFFIDQTDGLANKWVAANYRSHPADARTMLKIALQPETHRFGSFDGSKIRERVASYLSRVQRQAPGTVPMIATYRFLHTDCPNADGGGPGELAKYKTWIDKFAASIGNSHVVIFHEIDGLITEHCLTSKAQKDRGLMLNYALDKLMALPHTVVYLDAGSSDGPYSVASAAKILKRHGIAKANGFFLNATHYSWTKDEIAFGTKLSRAVGGKHFVINTAVNGRGPLRPHSQVKYGNLIRCNPAGRGLGPAPTTTNTGSPLVDAFAWIGSPGRSTDTCVGKKWKTKEGIFMPNATPHPATGVFWPAYALMLAKNAAF